RDTSDLTTLQSRGDEALAEGAERRTMSLTLATQKSLVWPRDFDVGDKVSVIINGVVYTDILREVAMQLDSEGQETITPAVATPNADVVRGVVKSLASQARRTSGRLKRIERNQ